ncbi:MAG TPA: hypothetical protein VIR45_12895 [Kiloniellaceae bacterium]
MRHLDQPSIRPDGLQVEDHRGYQEKLWTVERAAWIVFILITLAAALGATGAGGPLSRQVAVTEHGRIDYPRIARWQASDELTVEFAASSGLRSLRLSPEFARSFQVESVQPMPERVEATPDGQVMHFAAADGPAQVVMHLRPQSPGLARYRASLNGGAALEFWTLILP